MIDHPYKKEPVESGKKIQYSLVIPVYNEEDSLRALLHEILPTMDSLCEGYEVIFVNDGSNDRSSTILLSLKAEFPERVEIITLPQHRGQTLAMQQGFKAVCGQIVLTLDADLQNDPADILKLLAKMAIGYDVVCGWRQERQDPPLKVALSKLGNVWQRMLSGLDIHDVACTLRAYKREWAAKISLSWEGQHRFIPLSLSLQGCRVGEVVVHHRERKYGVSKYHHGRIFKVMADFFRVLISRGKA